MSRTTGGFLEPRASPSAGAACERSVGVPWELGLEQNNVQNQGPFGAVVGAPSGCLRRGRPWPVPALARGMDSPEPVAWAQAGASLGEVRLVENHKT